MFLKIFGKNQYNLIDLWGLAIAIIVSDQTESFWIGIVVLVLGILLANYVGDKYHNKEGADND